MSDKTSEIGHDPEWFAWEVIPRSSTDEPSCWWSALRFMQAYRTYEQLNVVAKRIMERFAQQRFVHVKILHDSPHPGAKTVEIPHFADLIDVEDKREASFIASETLHYLRSSLDHLIYNVSWIDTGSRQRYTQFPIVTDSANWGRKEVKKNLGGMTAEHASHIEQVQPYNDVTWTDQLQTLSNADKHRFGVEVSPAFQMNARLDEAVPSQTENQVSLTAIKNATLHFRLPAFSPYGEFVEVFSDMFRGAGQLINLFLEEAGIPLLEIRERIATDQG
jgi:hypothetical protein